MRAALTVSLKPRLQQQESATEAVCRACARPLRQVMSDLGMSPLCESFVAPDRLNEREAFYPLVTYVCEGCLLVQLEEYVAPAEIFSEYAYFSSYSDSWVEHARRYVEMIVERLALTRASRVVELASNDGYLLQHVVAAGIPCLGVEPAENVAKVARARGIPTIARFFGESAAHDLRASFGGADLIAANNVLAQVPDVVDFVRGIKVLLAEGGTVTIEFPHLLRLIEGNQFDTIYHEHFSYFSLQTARAIFGGQGLTVFDAEELATHGGSLRLYAGHAEERPPITSRLLELAAGERAAGLDRIETYSAFREQVEETKRALLETLIAIKRAGKTIVGYVAPGKGNTLLNYCGIGTDFLDFTVDRNPYKHGLALPGSRIPIRHPDAIRETRPDYVLILPWNLRDEIIAQLADIRAWGGRFILPIPKVEVVT